MLKNNVKIESEKINEINKMNTEKMKNDIADIKQDISDIKNKETVVVKEYNDRRIGFWGWLAISSIASAIASATIGVAKCLHNSSNNE